MIIVWWIWINIFIVRLVWVIWAQSHFIIIYNFLINPTSVNPSFRYIYTQCFHSMNCETCKRKRSSKDFLSKLKLKCKPKRLDIYRTAEGTTVQVWSSQTMWKPDQSYSNRMQAQRTGGLGSLHHLGTAGPHWTSFLPDWRSPASSCRVLEFLPLYVPQPLPRWSPCLRCSRCLKAGHHVSRVMDLGCHLCLYPKRLPGTWIPNHPCNWLKVRIQFGDYSGKNEANYKFQLLDLTCNMNPSDWLSSINHYIPFLTSAFSELCMLFVT